MLSFRAQALARRSVARLATRSSFAPATVVSRGLFKGSGPAPERILGLAAAQQAKDDPSFKVEPQIFSEFAIPNGVAVVTGGNGGLGLEMAITLAEAGCDVYGIDLPDTPSEDFETAAAYISKLGKTLTYIPGNVTHKSSMEKIIVGIAKEHGRLDVCVAAAGILGPHAGDHCTQYSEDVWKKVIDVNLSGVFYTSAAAAKGMIETKTKAGSIVMISSMSASITNRGHSWVGYNASKSGVLQLARSMACELGKDNIRVNTVSPGHIYTKMTAVLLDGEPEMGVKWETSNPMGRIGHVHEVRGVVAWLASSASSFCTGSDIIVSGGHHAW